MVYLLFVKSKQILLKFTDNILELGYNMSALTIFYISFTPKIRISIFEILNCLHSETQDGKRVEPADELH